MACDKTVTSLHLHMMWDNRKTWQQGSLLPWQGTYLEQSSVHTRQEGLKSLIQYLQTAGTQAIINSPVGFVSGGKC